MSISTFLSVQKLPEIVGRVSEIKKIKDAIFHSKASCHIILMRADGGMGKSRLAEEVLWRGGNLNSRKEHGNPPKENDWTREKKKAVVGDLIDVSATALHARANFIRAIREALVYGSGDDLNFSNYDNKYSEYKSKHFLQGDYNKILEMEQTAEQKFLEDYKKNSERSRVVLILDTVEKLYPIGGTDLLLREKLLQSEDMELYAYQWLIKQIEKGTLTNTTLILAGRGGEGHKFFEEVKRRAKKNQKCIAEEIFIQKFSLENAHQYFEALENQWKADKTEISDSLQETIKQIRADKNIIETLWLYTDGQPVRMALYTDILLESSIIPVPLLENPAEARTVKQLKEKMLEKQQEIEAGFVYQLFGVQSLAGEILKLLVRAPRGLTAEQIYYCLSSKPGESPADWEKRRKEDFDEQQRERNIRDEFKKLKHLAVVKIRWKAEKKEDNTQDGALQLGLQDEVYRIYARAMSRTDEVCEAEKSARKELYQKLQIWSEYKLQGARAELSKKQEEDERRLRFDQPALALRIQFPQLTPLEESERTDLLEQAQRWQMERLHYALLFDFTRTVNHVLFELADKERMANDELADSTIQAEFWQVLRDPAYALETLGNLEYWGSLRTNHDTLLIYERIGLQTDTSRWIKRFNFRKDYKKSVRFAEQVEKMIEKWGKNQKTGGIYTNILFWKKSWQHTLAVSERALWKNYARIMLGRDILAVIVEMESDVRQLEKLAQFTVNQVAIREKKENGFKGHPAEERVQQTIALYYNYMGYGYASLGLSAKAMELYGKSLLMMRHLRFSHMEANTRNNLSRVLSDRGHARGRQMCLDALDLRKKSGSLIEIGYSYNTLALIDNQHMRSDLAWIESAIAILYFQKAGEVRGQGLAYLQLSEALRRLSRQGAYHLHGNTSEEVLRVADEAVLNAIDKFTNTLASGEVSRRIEAWIEKGCVERDSIKQTGESFDIKQNERHYRDAIYYLELAANTAKSKEYKNLRLEADARVNIAWTHYLMGNFKESEATLQEVESILPKDCFITSRQQPNFERDDIFIYKQLSKVSGLRSRMALARFSRFVEEIKKEQKRSRKQNDLKEEMKQRYERRKIIKNSQETDMYLKDAAKFSVLSLAYAELLSPRSSSLTAMYDWLYQNLKFFNASELSIFDKYVRKYRAEYKVSKIKIADYSDLNQFIEHTFGYKG